MAVTLSRCTLWSSVTAVGLVAGCREAADLQAPAPPTVAQVVVTAPEITLVIGQTVQLSATARDSAGNLLDDRTFVWASGNTGVARVSETGLVAAAAEGQAAITATADEVTGDLTITVAADGTPPPDPDPPAPPEPPPPPPSGPPGLQPIASGLEFPVYLTSPPGGGDSRLFVVERGGTVRIIESGAVRPTPFLDISAKVATREEQGLLSLAFAPDYATSGRFFVYYTDLGDDTQVASFLVSGDPAVADAASETPVLSVKQPGPSHNGGLITFGPDGMLYIGLGDGGSRDGLDNGRGQSLDDLLGALLRIDVSSGSGYTTPSDNPFVGTLGAKTEIWAFGFRNPWRYSFDRATGDLFIADVGEGRWEEVNRATAAEGRGRGVNYGWSVMEGPDCITAGCDQSGLTLPILQHGHDQGCAITGGYVYRGATLPSLQGQYLYGDFCGGWVRSIPAQGATGTPTEWPALAPGGNITSFGEDAAGELYLLTADGGVFKIVPK
jgi:glucose/arabinose dehydrogenase